MTVLLLLQTPPRIIDDVSPTVAGIQIVIGRRVVVVGALSFPLLALDPSARLPDARSVPVYINDIDRIAPIATISLPVMIPPWIPVIFHLGFQSPTNTLRRGQSKS